MAFLYVLSEGEGDDLFIDLICERVTGQKFERTEEFRLRPGSNFKTALADARLLLNRFRKWSGPQDVAVVIAIDNDRAPGHPGAVELARPRMGSDCKKSPRFPDLQKQIEGTLGPDREKWPVDVAVAMPVEMIESWILILHNANRRALPVFKRANQPLARLYYGGSPSPQLRDLCEAEAAEHGLTFQEFFWKAVADGDINAAETASPSLKMFLDEVREWRCARN
jgi:hypothetical protein